MPLNVQCKRCANLYSDWCDKKHDSPDPDMIRDCRYYRTLTNYDRIISKSPEELAEWIYQMQDWDAHRKDNFLPPLPKSWWFDWLRQEATDEA